MKPTTHNSQLTTHNSQLTIRPKGFTLLELLVSVFIFSVVMIAISAVFARFITFQKRSQGIQRNMEDARYAMELMAKTLRTSSVVSCNNGACPAPPAFVNSVEVYDYSQEKCIRYYIQGNRIRMGSIATDRAGCNFGVIPAGTYLVNSYISSLDFRAIKTDVAASQVGRVTISVAVCSTNSCTGTENDRANLETTVSLRDYQESNP